MADYVSLEQAQELLLNQIVPIIRTEGLPLAEAFGRIVSEPVCAVIAQPPFDCAPLDGYALRHADTAGVSRQTPSILINRFQSSSHKNKK